MSSSGYNPYPPPPYQPPTQPPRQPPYGPPRDPFAQMHQPPRRGKPAWVWVLVGFGTIVFLCCGGFLGFAGYVGAVGPDTKVYVGNEFPKKFLDVVNELKLLDPGEQVKFFYSDGLTDIRNGMYFVTDRKVVIYRKDAGTPATVVPFSKIADANLQSESWPDEGTITLRLTDRTIVAFPVSSEQGRDKLMWEAILGGAGLKASDSSDTSDTALEK